MEEKGNKLPAGADAGTNGAAPLFTEEAEETACPVVPLRRPDAARGAAKRSRPAPGRRPRNLLLALAVLAAGAAGTAGGYLASVGEAPGPPASAITHSPPESPPPQPVTPRPVPAPPSDAPGAAGGQRMRVEMPARYEPERAITRESAGGERDEDAKKRAERAREEEERRREDAEERAERAREEAEERAERRRRDAEKRGKPKSRLIGVVTERPRP